VLLSRLFYCLFLNHAESHRDLDGTIRDPVDLTIRPPAICPMTCPPQPQQEYVPVPNLVWWLPFLFFVSSQELPFIAPFPICADVLGVHFLMRQNAFPLATFSRFQLLLNSETVFRAIYAIKARLTTYEQLTFNSMI
jgi:hypothetical protein